jgi:Zn2+/Cd2+-exporting ATPase
MSIGYIFLGSRPAGIFCLSDVCRTGAKEALQELKSMGIKTVMLTGDSFAAAKHAQNQVNTLKFINCTERALDDPLQNDYANFINFNQ